MNSDPIRNGDTWAPSALCTASPARPFLGFPDGGRRDADREVRALPREVGRRPLLSADQRDRAAGVVRPDGVGVRARRCTTVLDSDERREEESLGCLVDSRQPWLVRSTDSSMCTCSCERTVIVFRHLRT